MFSSNTSQVSSDANWIEECFQTHLYTGNDSTQTINNGIDLSTKGGLVWIKARNTGSTFNCLFDTARGATKALFSNATNAQGTYTDSLTAFNTTGFTLGADTTTNFVNSPTGQTEASWTFRKQPKFFDVVTWTGNGSSTQTISHNLGAAPGCIITKSTSYDAGASDSWLVYHRSLTTPNNYFLQLSNTNAQGNIGSNMWNVTSTTFRVSNAAGLNASGQTYVAYLFAHDAGGFGLTGTDNVVSCGSFSLDSAVGVDVNLGYEAQWVLIKRTDSSAGSSGWYLLDTMRGWTVDELYGDKYLVANTSAAEAGQTIGRPTATGFAIQASTWLSTGSYIYIAIRRGPMKVPTDATKVFSPNASNAPADGTQITTGFPTDLSMWKSRGGSYSGQFQDRLRGLPSTAGSGTATLYPDSTAAESNNQTGYEYWNTGFKTYSGENNIWWSFRRAPSFFDEVCYTGTGSPRTLAHNLTVPPELMIIKPRSGTGSWFVGNTFTDSNFQYAFLESTLSNQSQIYAYGGAGYYLFSRPDATGLYINGYSAVNGSGTTYVAYLFATCAGVSKVGSYTGTGTTLQVNCGFTAGSRFVLIKRTDSTGDWYVWDSARGIVSGNDPYLLLNSTAAEVTNTDYVDTYSAGFEISSSAPSAINASGGTFIFFAVA